MPPGRTPQRRRREEGGGAGLSQCEGIGTTGWGKLGGLALFPLQTDTGQLDFLDALLVPTTMITDWHRRTPDLS